MENDAVNDALKMCDVLCRNIVQYEIQSYDILRNEIIQHDIK